MSFNPTSGDDAYFNDLSRQPQIESRGSESSQDPPNGPNANTNGEDAGLPKPKRIACVICRKRKLKCDGNKPKCATCDRLGHNCAYDEVRRKSGPKRGYVKDLEARLAQVESQLTSRNKKAKKTDRTIQQSEDPDLSFNSTESLDMQPGPRQSISQGSFNTMPTTNDPFLMPITTVAPEMVADPKSMPNIDLNLDQSFSWEMIDLGLEEPMPTQEAVDELTQVYFERVHPSLPMIHKYRYQTSMNLAPERRPPICLRYIMWCHAASITDKYMDHQDIFYRRARKYMELDEMKGQGEVFVTLAHAQTWSLISAYEFKMMYFPKAWMSVGRAARLALMMGLNRVDGAGMDVKECLPPPRDWTEREERRRTFWMAYCIDRYASIGTGWPMTIDDRDILSYLPASEGAYESGKPENAPTLSEAMTPQQATSLSAFAGVVLVTHFFGLNLTHLHRPEPNQREDDLNGFFWQRHRRIDNKLLNTALLLPSHLRLPAGIKSPNIVFLNLSIHTSTICLHQTAIFKAEKFGLPKNIVEQSRARCIMAAAEIAGVMRLASHLDLTGMNPFMAFCLHVAARVFVQYLRSSPNDQEVRASLEFLITAMEALQRKSPLNEAFLAQLNLEIESRGLDIFLHNQDCSSQYADIVNNCKGLASNVENIGHCSQARVHISESGSEGRSPEDMRYPPNISAKATIRSDSPRQSQYAFRNIDLAARETRKKNNTYWSKNGDIRHKVAPFFPENNAQPSKTQKSFSGEEWNAGNMTAMTGVNSFTDSETITNINMQTAFDTAMTDQSNHSRGFTPQSSNSYNHSSSNTSYSPSQVHDEESTATQQASTLPNPGTNNSYAGFAAPKDGCNIFNSQGSDSAGSLRQEDPFKIPPDWDLGAGAMPATLSGMTPEGGWEKMMEGMNWEQRTI